MRNVPLSTRNARNVKKFKTEKSLKIRSLHLFRDVVFSVHRFVLFSAPPALFSLTSFWWNNFNDVLHDCFVTGSRLISRTRRVLSTGKLLIPEYQAAHCCVQKKNKKKNPFINIHFFFIFLFFYQNMYLNFGEIGQNIKTLMTEFQQNVKSNQRLESISDMKVSLSVYL